MYTGIRTVVAPEVRAAWTAANHYIADGRRHHTMPSCAFVKRELIRVPACVLRSMRHVAMSCNVAWQWLFRRAPFRSIPE